MKLGVKEFFVKQSRQQIEHRVVQKRSKGGRS